MIGDRGLQSLPGAAYSPRHLREEVRTVSRKAWGRVRQMGHDGAKERHGGSEERGYPILSVIENNSVLND